MREYRYLPAEGITFGVDTQDDYARVALTACNDVDTFSPDAGRDLIDLLLDKSDATLRACSLRRNVVRFPYNGKRPRRDILKPLLAYLADELGERGFFRALLSYYESGITSNKDAVAATREMDDESIYLDYARMMENFEEEEQELFADVESEEELYQLFFPWKASVGSLVKKMKSFVSAVWTKEIVLGVEESEPKYVAPRRPNPESEAVKSYTAKPVVELDVLEEVAVENRIEEEEPSEVANRVSVSSDNS